MIDTSFESVLVTASWAPSGEMAMLCGPSPTGIVCSTVTAWGNGCESREVQSSSKVSSEARGEPVASRCSKQLGVAWSGGKDSLVLEKVMALAGFSDCVLVLTTARFGLDDVLGM